VCKFKKLNDKRFQEWYLPFLKINVKKIPPSYERRRGIRTTEL
jgi:hypothetical protein